MKPPNLLYDFWGCCGKIMNIINEKFTFLRFSMKQVEKYDVLVIGAGPSGLVSAYCAAKKGKSVCVLEKEQVPARKIYASGNGRCNYSNLEAPHSAQTIEFLREDFGIEPAEEDGRIYPRSFEASSFAQALVLGAQRAGVKILCSCAAAAVQKNAQGFVVECEDGSSFAAEKLILASGGKAGIQYGCTGDGYKFAQSLGCSIIKPIPALDGLTCKENLDDLHGVRVRAKASLLEIESGAAPHALAEDSGEVQFTKDGISGICVMNLSRNLRFEEGKSFELVLDLFPEIELENLAAMLLKRKQDYGCGMSWLLPEKLKEYLHTRRPDDIKGPAGMAVAAKHLSFEITGTRGWKTAQTTSGGVPISELTENYESAVCPGLYITGELADYDGLCGGFNINHAVYSGMMAGSNI